MVNLKKANQISNDIAEVEQFIATIDPEKNTVTNFENDINMILKKRTTVFFSIFGSRWGESNYYEHEIKIPNVMINQLQKLAIELKEKLEQELLETLNNRLKAV